MRGFPALLAVAALTVAACADDGARTGGGTTPDGEVAIGDDDPSTPGGGSARFPRALVRFDSCDAFLDHVKAEARERVGPYGLDGQERFWIADDMVVEEPAEEPAAESADEPASAPSADTGATAGAAGDGDGGSFTGTNVQEAGVDEPDIVKTDGDRILTISDNVLSYVDIASGEPILTDQLRLDLGWGHELFFRGDRALLFTNGGNWGEPVPMIVEDVATGDAEAEFADEAMPPPPLQTWGPSATIIEIDLSDPANLRVTATMQIEGQYLSARAIGDHVRLAVSSGPNDLPWLYPGSAAGEERAEEANREVIDDSTIEDWAPSYQYDDGDSSRSGQLVACDQLHHPADFSGFDVVSIVDLDLSAGLAPSFDAVGVLAGGQTIYSSMDRFYVATTKWLPPDADSRTADVWSEDFRTEVHAFAIAPGEPTTYVASGAVDGSLLNQFSLDEHNGDLRIVHTDGSPWNEGDLSETFLTVLREDGDRLVEIGSVGGLGKGEQLYAARLMGDVGFAVTFRQVDPFYVLDLSDPTNPRIAGELKIPGFSTYLHPVGEGRVLGIGQDATEDGRVTGFKLSLFDVSDPSDPREISVWTTPNAESPAQWDHRAFQMWDGTAIVPLRSWSGGWNGVTLFDIGDEITEVGQVSHIDGGAPLTSDCRTITADDLTPEMSELWWMAQDGHVQICGPDATGGWPGHTCERIDGEEIQWWFYDDATRDDDLAALGLDDDDTVELCWPDYYRESIQRSLVADGVLYTISPSTLQANHFDTLDLIGQVTLR